MPDMLVQVPLPDAVVGTRLRLDRVVTSDAGLAPLARGGRLYVIALHPPPEQVWLLAVLDQPTFDGAQWIATPSELAITDITALRSQLRFESGTGWSDWCEACQQTHWYGAQPHVLTAEDVALLDHAAGREPIAVTEPVAVRPGLQRGDLLDAVLANPASDEARAIYADQLLAEADLRGEYIHVELALAGPLSIRKRARLAARRAHLLAGYAAIWWPYSVKRWETQKGFLRAVHGTWPQLAPIAERLFASEPVTELGLYRLDALDEAALSTLATAPWLARLARLILRGLPDDATCARLASAPQLADLRGLDVSNNALAGAGLPAIARALPRVASLALSGNELADEALSALHGWTRLEKLYLSSCALRPPALEHVLDGAFPGLAMLALSHNPLGDDGAAALARHAAHVPALVHLELKNCELGAAGARALIAAFPALRRLDLRRNQLDPAIARGDPRILV